MCWNTAGFSDLCVILSFTKTIYGKNASSCVLEIYKSIKMKDEFQ